MSALQTFARLFMSLCAILVGGFGVVEVVYGGVYYDSYTCNSSVIESLTPTLWLVVSGCARFLGGVLFLSWVLCPNCISDLITVFLAGFDIAWGTVGGIILWDQCRDLQPDNLRIFMWIAVIWTCASFLQAVTIGLRSKVYFGESVC